MSKKSTLIDLACAQRRQMVIVIALVITMGLFSLLSLVVVRPGDRAYPILVFDLVLVASTLVFFVFAFRYCTKREMEE